MNRGITQISSADTKDCKLQIADICITLLLKFRPLKKLSPLLCIYIYIPKKQKNIPPKIKFFFNSAIPKPLTLSLSGETNNHSYRVDRQITRIPWLFLIFIIIIVFYFFFFF